MMVIGTSDFRDEELLEPKAILEKAGAQVIIASTSLNKRVLAEVASSH